ncbi:hypothetical protein VPHD482_0218 [Vibrio phage D482]
MKSHADTCSREQPRTAKNSQEQPRTAKNSQEQPRTAKNGTQFRKG